MTPFLLLATLNVLSSGLISLDFIFLILNMGVLTFASVCGSPDHMRVYEVPRCLEAEALHPLKCYSYVLYLFVITQQSYFWVYI